MTRRSRQQAVPDWPKALALPAKVLDETGPAPTMEELKVAIPDTLPSGTAVALTASPDAVRTVEARILLTQPVRSVVLTGVTAAPLTALFFGLTKDGRHLAAEAQVTGDKVTALTPLCCSIHAQESAKAWEACAFARLCHGREYSATERQANSVQGKSARVEDVAEGCAVALVKRAGKTVALAMEVEGATVKEPKVLGSGDRLYAWQEAHAFAQRWFLPKRRKGT